MDPPPPRTPSPHPDPDTSKPKRSGRPPLSNNKRTVQIRMAQRAYRERKENKIKELEDRVAFLTSSSPAPCLSCADLRTRTEECLAQVAILNQRITELQQICGITPSVSGVTSGGINGIWYTQPQSLTNVSRATMSPVRSDSGFVTTTTTNTMIPRSCDSPVRQSTDLSFSAPMLRTSANLSHDQSLASFPP
ncbi:hypothetical protein BCR33DRAFT_786794 [Rhizoclosmatium globosum]|uniref:BZIP domain-containing protein n=1 Tax=Rhizoclosmatium globosum TaxID=329046 RepID=A0A1Y2C3E9_9FUNG|nr:hypothetical protein BCR33DRAFT_786794 [Rhizoclosmatium globosum]|eukprot:ORY41549.1 hypothetical protein BCR33DRAFT_786794 [Rhizoclosmatium globosum]